MPSSNIIEIINPLTTYICICNAKFQIQESHYHPKNIQTPIAVIMNSNHNEHN